jgi:hypothetical protein
MAPKEKQKIEIEKTHGDPLLSFNQAVTVDCSDFLGTALNYHLKAWMTRCLTAQTKGPNTTVLTTQISKRLSAKLTFSAQRINASKRNMTRPYRSVSRKNPLAAFLELTAHS